MDSGILNIITPCKRPENLLKLSESIQSYKGWEVNWYIIFDSHKEIALPWQIKARMDIKIHKWYFPTFNKGVVGQEQRNIALNLIDKGYMYQLDDDNLMHLDFQKALDTAVGESEPVVIFGQAFLDGTTRLQALPDNTKVFSIDNAQFLVPRGYIGDLRYELVYHGDGLFIEELYKRAESSKKHFIWKNLNLSYYNALR